MLKHVPKKGKGIEVLDMTWQLFCGHQTQRTKDIIFVLPERSVGIWCFVLFFYIVLVILTGNYKVHLNSNGYIWHSSVRELEVGLKATRLRARDRDTSTTLIGGKGGTGGPSSLLHTTLEGPTVGACECKMDGKSTWIPPTWHRMGHVLWSLGLNSKTNHKIGTP